MGHRDQGSDREREGLQNDCRNHGPEGPERREGTGTQGLEVTAGWDRLAFLPGTLGCEIQEDTAPRASGISAVT